MEDTYTLQMADTAVVTLVLLSGLIGLFRGFVREVLGIGSWALALFVSLYSHAAMFSFWSKRMESDTLAHVTAFGVVFISILSIALIITDRISDRIGEGALNSVDRTFGFGFGALRGVVIVCLLFMLITGFKNRRASYPEWIRDAHSLPLIEDSAKVLIGLLPKKIEKQAAESVNLKEPKDTRSRARTSRERPLKDSPTRGQRPSKSGGYNQQQRDQMEDLIEEQL
jgi:membrane protein required for colicin V production